MVHTCITNYLNSPLKNEVNANRRKRILYMGGILAYIHFQSRAKAFRGYGNVYLPTYQQNIVKCQI